MKDKINKDKLQEIRRREIMIKEQILIVESLELNKRLYVKKVLENMGFDKDKNYNINLDSGKVVEQEKPKEKTE